MKTLALILVLCAAFLEGHAQSYWMSFTGKGDAVRIDSIIATNLRSGQTFTVYETELLNIMVGGAFCQTSDGLEVHQYGMIYPNPFSGVTNIVVNAANRQNLTVSVRNLAGQVVLETSLSVEPGGNEFAVSLSKAGTYFITAKSPQGTACYQATCTGSTGVGNSIVFKGLTASMEFPSGLGGYKTGPPHLEFLPMQRGDVIHYACYSGDMVTYLTDSPGASGNYEVQFTKCTDAAGPIMEGFQRMGQCTFFWAASEYNVLQGWSRRLGCTQNGIERKPSAKSSGYSVRCVKDVLWDDVIKDTGN